jgi:hypothetical protein
MDASLVLMSSSERTIGSEIIIKHLVLLGEVSQAKACFGPFGDRVNLGAR